MLLLASTISMLESMVRKNPHSRYMSCRNLRPVSGCLLIQDLKAEPKPNQPGSIRRHCAQEKTQGMARRCSIFRVLVREAAAADVSVAISVITVEPQK